MKKLKYIFRVLLIVCVVVLVSCKDDENDNKLQTIIATVPFGTPYFNGADIYLVGDMNDWKIVEAFKMSSFGYALDTIEGNSDDIIAGRKYSITLTNLAPGTEYKYIVVVDGQEYTEASAASGTYPYVNSQANDVPNHKLDDLRAAHDTVKNWTGITVNGQLAHKFTLEAPTAEGDVYLVGDMNEFKVNSAYKMNKDSDGKYSLTVTLDDIETATKDPYVKNGNTVYSYQYQYVLVDEKGTHIELQASSPATDCPDAVSNRKVGLFEVRVSDKVLNWQGVTACLTPTPEPETE
ncbi:MAG: hypothetical protein LBV47_09760 [Bacteroidales bacterium]|jgi:hypothetical protein|nr:hypothetical protein [Bacteroidales bacterium]